MEIYENVPLHGGETREVAKVACKSQLANLMRTEAFRKVLYQVPGLAVDVLHIIVTFTTDGEEERGKRGWAEEFEELRV